MIPKRHRNQIITEADFTETWPARWRDDLPAREFGRLLEVQVPDGAGGLQRRFLQARGGMPLRPAELVDVTGEVTERLAERLADSRHESRKAASEKRQRLQGQPEVKPVGKRRKGSRRQPKVEERHYGLGLVPLLDAWYRSRKIAEHELRAGNRFNADLQGACGSNIQAMDPARLRVDSSPRARSRPAGGPGPGPLEAVQGPLQAVGGINSKAGSVLWHIVGLEKSILQWCREHNDQKLSRNEVVGLLVGTLETLARYYGYREQKKAG